VLTALLHPTEGVPLLTALNPSGGLVGHPESGGSSLLTALNPTESMQILTAPDLALQPF
jgi:hypothetical protein